jgi:hypothetical protein
MNINEIVECFEKSGYIKSRHYFDRYIKLIKVYQDHNLKKSRNMLGEIESHHILPGKIWNEFYREKWNKVSLPARAHIIAHYLLYKAIARSECAFAFNQMWRITKKTGFFNSRFYRDVRLEVAEMLSKINTGKKRTDAQKQNMSAVHGGTNVYRHKHTGELKRYIIGQQPLEFEPFQIGRPKSDASRTKLGNSMRGRIWQFNPETKEVIFDREIRNGFIKGIPSWFDNNSHQIKDSKWVHDPVTGKHLRCKPEDIPDGYVMGRKYHNAGYEKLNNSNLVKRLDVIDKCYVMIPKEILPNARYITHGSSIDGIYVIYYNQNTFYSWDDFLKGCPEVFLGKNPRDMRLLDCIVPKKHFNQTPERREFCDKNAGKTFREIGIILKKFKEK